MYEQHKLRVGDKYFREQFNEPFCDVVTRSYNTFNPAGRSPYIKTQMYKLKPGRRLNFNKNNAPRNQITQQQPQPQQFQQQQQQQQPAQG